MSEFFNSILAKADVQVLHVEEIIAPLSPPRPVIAIHAGPENVSPSCRKQDLEVIKSVAIATYRFMMKNIPALDVIEYAIRHLETYYMRQYRKKSGYDFEWEADAGILEDTYIKGGCVGCVQNYRHPISLAKFVARKTEHILIVGEGTKKIAEEMSDDDLYCEDEEDLCSFDDLNILSESEITKEKSNYWPSEQTSNVCGMSQDVKAKKLKANEKETSNFKLKVFGAVTYDNDKHFGCGTVAFRSEAKNFGRLSAQATVIGSGLAAELEIGCACISGDDEPIYVHGPARAVVDRMSFDDRKIALKCEIDELAEKTGARNIGGMAIDASGVPHVYSTAESFPWVYCVDDMIFYGCVEGESMCEKIDIGREKFGCFCPLEKISTGHVNED